MSWLNVEWSLLNIVLIVGVLVALMLLYSSIVYVPNNRVGVLERLWAAKGSVERGLVALGGEAGYVPELLRGGFHLLFPFQYRVHKVDLVAVPQGEIGYVFARDGRPLEAGQSLAGNGKADDFESVRDFLAAGGQKGPQRKVLREGVYAINIAQFVVLTRANTYAVALAKSDADTIETMRAQIEARGGFHPVVIGESAQGPRVVDTGSKEPRATNDVIGIVTVHDGPGLPAGELIAPAVGADRGIAAAYHNNFQDADRFLAAGGFRGRQYQVLVDGTYYINRLFASVEFVEKTIVPMGMVGVVVSFTGRRGEDRSGVEYQHGELVGEGERGVWEMPLLPGKYPFNRFAGSI